MQLKFELILTYTKSSNGQLKKFLFLVTAAILNGGREYYEIKMTSKSFALKFELK
jgi:hypothetical protein